MLDNPRAVSALIGSVLFENSLINNVMDVQPEHIPGAEGAVWGAMLALSMRGVPINGLSIAGELGEQYHERARAILSAAVNGTPAVGNIEQYAEQVLDAFERRQAIVYAEELVRGANDMSEDIGTSKANIAGRLLRGGKRSQEFSAEELAERDLPQVEAWAADPLEDGHVRGLSTGLNAIDTITDGLWPSFFIVAGRTSMGKTALGTQLSVNISATAPVYYVGLEHPPIVYWRRMVGQMSGIAYRSVKRGLRPDELRQWKRAGDILRKRRFAIYNGSRSLPLVMAAITRAYHRWGELGLVVVDNLGHLKSGDERIIDELNTVSLRMLEQSQRLNTTIMGLHQINRGVESRDNKRPQMSDLRDSGHLEQNADLIGLLYRDEYYNENTDSPNVMECAIAKNREDGTLGIATMFMNKRTGGITDVRLNY